MAAAAGQAADARVAHRWRGSGVAVAGVDAAGFPLGKEVSGVRFDRDKLVRQRQRLGYSQETLASLANVGVRTVQRAETGEAVRRENMADLAAALRLPLHALLTAEEEPEPAQEGEPVWLRRAGSAREILDLLEGSRMAKLECDADPTAETMPALTETIDLIEPLLPDPWKDPPAFASLGDRLRATAAIDAALERLSQHGLAVFVGRRFEQAIMPREYDEGYLVPRRAKPEPVAAARLLISAADRERRSVDATTRWPVEVVAAGSGE